jgi:hypothetical protein
MAFLPSSRYAQLATVEVSAAGGRTETIVKLRRLPPTAGTAYPVAAHDRLDVIAFETYGDSSESWHIADANTELDATALVVPGRIISVPEK